MTRTLLKTERDQFTDASGRRILALSTHKTCAVLSAALSRLEIEVNPGPEEGKSSRSKTKTGELNEFRNLELIVRQLETDLWLGRGG